MLTIKENSDKESLLVLDIVENLFSKENPLQSSRVIRLSQLVKPTRSLKLYTFVEDNQDFCENFKAGDDLIQIQVDDKEENVYIFDKQQKRIHELNLSVKGDPCKENYENYET